MFWFIVFAIVYMGGMGSTILLEIENTGFALLSTVVFLTCGVIVVWNRHGEKITLGAWQEILEDEDPIPGLLVVFILAAAFSFGIYRYVNAMTISSPRHIEKIMGKHDDKIRWNMTARVIEEPTLKGGYLEVILQPERVQQDLGNRSKRSQASTTGNKGKKTSKGRKKGKAATETAAADQQADGDETQFTQLEDILSPPEEIVDEGWVLARVYEDSPSFQEVKFNQRVELTGRFSSPSAQRNPGSLDYQRFLRNRGVFRTIRIAGPRSRLKIISEDQTGSIWYRFALYLRSEILKIIKQTMPYPESSFLGGVLLGLRGGLPQIINDEFRMTGVSHVLAVSGLHVTIIAGLFYGLFTMFRVPLKVFAPMVVFALFTFALIVGWPSSAVRAALMNSLFILSRAYLRQFGFRLSILFSLSVAAVYILTLSPLQITEPSFVLSFMAIYALAVFTDPAEKFLRGALRGNGLYFAFSMFFLFYAAVVIKRDLCLHPWFFPVATIFWLVTTAGTSFLAKTSTFQSFSFELLPNWLQSFVSAQVAILLAMMGPLSAFYFGQMSLAAPIANMIAIPLIGIIVQVGLIAGLIGAFIPFIGLHLALLINAANWLGVKFFLGMAHFFAVIIPFPRVSQPDFGSIFLYYAVLHVVFFARPLYERVCAFIAALREVWEEDEFRPVLTLIGSGILGVFFFIVFFALARVEQQPALRLTVLDVGFGNSILLEHGKQAALIDTGFNDTLSEYDAGERVLQPAISSKMVKEIRTVFLATILPERTTGLINILADYKVQTIAAPFPIPTNGKSLSFPDFLKIADLADVKLNANVKKGMFIGAPPNYFWERAHDGFNALIKLIAQKNIEVKLVLAGDPLPGFEKCTKLLFPQQPHTRFNAYYDHAILEITEGSRRFIFAGSSLHPLRREEITGKVDGLLLADIPIHRQDFPQILQKFEPGFVAVSFRNPSAWVLDGYYAQASVAIRGMRFGRQDGEFRVPIMRTDHFGAIQIDVTDREMKVRPFLDGHGKPGKQL